VKLHSLTIHLSLSEYGCIKTDRTWDEIGTLYSDQMTPVYSGGLVYEYTEEGDARQSKYGLVQIKGDDAVEKNDFTTLAKAFSNTPSPKGDGGYNPSGSASSCPPKSDTFLQEDEGLPGLPKSAEAFFKNGAGNGVGLEGPGSQDVGDESSGTATAGSGKVTASAGSSSTKKGDAGHLRAPAMSAAPFVCGLIVLTCSFLGASLL
jgi:1,3-beta-glucanosyltransferase GAS5